MTSIINKELKRLAGVLKPLQVPKMLLALPPLREAASDQRLNDRDLGPLIAAFITASANSRNYGDVRLNLRAPL